MPTLKITALTLLVACFGTTSGPSAPLDGGTADDGTPRLECPEGTLQQSGTTETGEEYWCARGGVMHGPFVEYHRNGKRAASGHFIDNQRSGQWTWWYEGDPAVDREPTRMKGKYDRGKQIGSWRWWHENGNRKMEGDFLLGRKQGQWSTFYESGHKESEGFYHNNDKNEVWSYFADDDTATVVRTERYEAGKLVEEKKR